MDLVAVGCFALVPNAVGSELRFIVEIRFKLHSERVCSIHRSKAQTTGHAVVIIYVHVFVLLLAKKTVIVITIIESRVDVIVILLCE